MTSDSPASASGDSVTTERDVFARNFGRIVRRSGLSRRQFAERHWIDYKTLCRWLAKGVTNPDKRTREKLLGLCQISGERFENLWKEQVSTADICAERMREIFSIWQQAGISLDDWVSSLRIAARVAQRLRQEEPELARRICRVRPLRTEADLHLLLENVVKPWLNEEKLSEADAFNRLREWALGPLDK